MRQHALQNLLRIGQPVGPAADLALRHLRGLLTAEGVHFTACCPGLIFQLHSPNSRAALP